MRLLLVAVAALLLAVAHVSPVSAWQCAPGVPDTPENQMKGLCVLNGTPVVKHHHDTTPVPTATPIPPPPTPAPHKDGSREQYCVWEPTTQQMEIRWTTNSTPPGPRPLAPGVCEQPVLEEAVLATATPFVTTSSVAVEQAPQIVTPEVVASVPEQQTTVAETETPQETPPSDIHMPTGLPDTGDGSCAEVVCDSTGVTPDSSAEYES